ncbi:Hypothetical protein FKW44_004432 [Caligus rogercresseyi]|uniref:Uncharacterized protein n=1 Tax=Caligus rogercresseyi TaxID=217165 RepID=A0A7T8KAK0_CALRO|nr:Hypothetical protein FKW44_004432 [Caligus rogercresseyi]
MSEGSMRNLVKKDLGMTPYKKIRLQLLSEATIEKRRERGRILLNKLKSGTQGPVLHGRKIVHSSGGVQFPE